MLSLRKHGICVFFPRTGSELLKGASGRFTVSPPPPRAWPRDMSPHRLVKESLPWAAEGPVGGGVCAPWCWTWSPGIS